MGKKEYIDRGALIKAITESTESTWGNGLGRSWWSHSVQLKDNMVRCINNQAAADVVEVVRCKDCKHYHEYLHHSTKESTGWGRCTYIAMDIDLMANDFCSYGERKDDDHEASDGN